MNRIRPTNPDIADLLEQVAALLQAQDANPFRVRAYAEAAANIRSMDGSVAELYEREGRSALEQITGVGESLSGALATLLDTGRFPLLDRLQGEVSPEDLFATVPGIGSELAARISDALDIETLEELEFAAHDGRLGQVSGFGPKRVRLVRDALDGILDRAVRRRSKQGRPEAGGRVDPSAQPGVELLLGVDQRYRRAAAAGELRTIAPRRFNPDREAWLPIMHHDEQGWAFTALYSNSARAHELGKTDDWVVIYFERDGEDGRSTVVTETRGPMKGRRVVRGRERECERVYLQNTG